MKNLSDWDKILSNMETESPSHEISASSLMADVDLMKGAITTIKESQKTESKPCETEAEGTDNKSKN